jgi:hypothetical protein
MRKLVSLLIVVLSASCSPKIVENSQAEIVSISTEKNCTATLEDGSQLPLTEGLPADVEIISFYTKGENIYCTTMKSGLFKLNDENVWIQLLDENFKRRTMLDGVDEFRKVTGFAQSSNNPLFIAAATKHSMYLSYNGGVSWEKVKDKIKIEDYINSLEIDSEGAVWIGTSYNGIYKLHNDEYDNISKGLYYEPYAGEVIFYDTIAMIEEIDETLYASQLFNKGLYSLQEGIWIKEKIESTSATFYIQDLFSKDGTVYATGSNSIIQKNENGWNTKVYNIHPVNPGTASAYLNMKDNIQLSYRHHVMEGAFRNETQKMASHKRAIYTNIHLLKANLPYLIRTIKLSGLNSLVIDVKDDNGHILTDIDYPPAVEIGAVKNSIDFKPILKQLRDEEIYSIARMVVFKDKQLFRANNGEYAIWDNKHDRPWRANNSEYWCDAHSDFVRNYNVQLAKKVAELGFDEIQFDYIRFPADGPLERCLYRYKKDEEMFKSEVLDDFLQQARAEIQAPISVDIYGFTAFYNFGNRIGQDIEIFGKHVDVVSAMIYPSHYGINFYKDGPRYLRPYRIVYDTGIRSRFLSNDKAIMRPYVQAFDMHSPTFGPGYILYQVNAANESGCEGYIFWHAGGSYGVVRRALQQPNI